ncbi:MAG TPA: tetratricopeptide repeat protein [Terriglobales bacterium]|nr:tetratricopeptide repeat protein [Terriglobales bacterium]
MSGNDMIGEATKTSVPSGRREALILFSLLAITVSALVGVGALVRRFNSWQDTLAQRMNQRGEFALQAGQAALAINFFRSALSFKHDYPAALFYLAESLIAENRIDEAEAYLHTLWDRQPQDGTINLELARLAARRHQPADALRYYHNAVYGIWSNDPVQNRVAARFELINLLLQQNALTETESELIAMQSGLPRDSQLHTRVAQLFLKVGDYRSAENEFRQALKLDRNNELAAAGAGQAAFRLGHYRTAILYLDAAMATAPSDQKTRDMLDTARLVLENDSFLRNLSALERQERILKGYRVATKRLDTCLKAQTVNSNPASIGPQTANPTSMPPGTQAVASGNRALQNLVTRERQLRSQMSPAKLTQNPELPAAAMNFVFDVEEQTEEICGEPSGIDEALLLIGRNREGVER